MNLAEHVALSLRRLTLGKQRACHEKKGSHSSGQAPPLTIIAVHFHQNNSIRQLHVALAFFNF